MTIKKIMVVDDSPTERAFMEGMLKKRGYEVLLVDSGEAAIERAAVPVCDTLQPWLPCSATIVISSPAPEATSLLGPPLPPGAVVPSAPAAPPVPLG